jgi:tetratricopeptide (TPR) repeat protein
MPHSVTSTLDQIIAAHQQGDLARAEILCRQVIAGEPGNFQAWYMLAALAFQQQLGPDALVALEKALALNQKSPEAFNLKGAVLRAMDRKDKALESFSTALKLQPDNPDLWLNRSSVLGDLGRTEDALADVDKALKLRPSAQGWNNRGAALRALKRHDEALKSFEKALALQPGYIQAMRNIAAVKCESFRVEEGLADYAAQAKLAYGGAAKNSMSPKENWELPQKQRHDAEQKAWLAGEGIHAPYYLDEGARVPGAAVNPLNAAPIAEQWARNRPQIVVIDNLLTPEALEGLRRFAHASTVWRKVYREGYLGATPEYGFACPLLAQIADELPAIFPTTFERHPLRYMWGFKYDSSLNGIDIHADFAAVNVNFWITPDEANNDPESGGLVLWDVAAPKEWDVAKYNRDVAANRQFLDSVGARPITVPYRANRAVVFDSDLFHKTDRIDFKTGYLNRRINITMLYGDR